MGTQTTYRERVIDRELDQRLRTCGAVLVEGPRGCGVTETADRRAATAFFLGADELDRRAADLDPEGLLASPTPVLLDQWQHVPSLWQDVRRAVRDRAPATGLFLMTGSAPLTEEEPAHDIAVLRMRPLSLLETGHSTGQASLHAVLAGEDVTAGDPRLSVPDLFDRISIGGWPALLGASAAEAETWLRDFLDEVVLPDLAELGVPRRDAPKVLRLLAAFGRSVGTTTTVSELAEEARGAGAPVARVALARYLAALTRLHLVEDSPAWTPPRLSGAPLVPDPRRYFVDPSLAVAALGRRPAHRRGSLHATAALFENLVVRDVRTYVQALGGRVHHCLDQTGDGVDIVITLPGGRWAGFQVRLSPADTQRAAASLLAFTARLDLDRVGRPVALGVITSTGSAFRRPDGVAVLPIGTLGP
jgi:predicted AAA+ superfamily ATPase